jgi:hypothetical protein
MVNHVALSASQHLTATCPRLASTWSAKTHARDLAGMVLSALLPTTSPSASAQLVTLEILSVDASLNQVIIDMPDDDHRLAELPITYGMPENQRHNRMLSACCVHSAHSTQKPMASAIFP